MKKTEFLYFIVAIVLLAIVSVDIYWWMSISSDSSKTFPEVQAEYHQKFPSFLRNGRLITVINIALLSMSGLLFFKTYSVDQLKKISMVFMVVCWILVVWQIFSLL